MDPGVYLDSSASTCVQPAVLEAMLPYFSGGFGNPSSLHSPGRAARQAVEDARARIAGTIGARDAEIVFTSGGTESNNLALKGVAFANRSRGRHVILSAIEHDSVLNSARWLAAQGFEATKLPVDGEGFVEPARLAAAIRSDTTIVSVMHANNEIGTLEPIEELGALCRERGVYFHSDACQSFPYIAIDVRRMAVDLLTINAHKIGGPKGVGALYVREGTAIMPWQHGGGHERGLRSSTENVPGIVGFAVAAELCSRRRDDATAHAARLRDKIIDRLLSDVPGAYLNGPRDRRLPNNVNVGFRGLEGEAIRLLFALDDAGFAVSTGSACSSNEAENKPSHVLAAIGRNGVEARGALRVTLGPDNTEDEIDRFLDVLREKLEAMRPISSMSLGGIAHA